MSIYVDINYWYISPPKYFIKSPQSGVTLHFQFFSTGLLHPLLQRLLAFMSKPFVPNLTYLGQRIYWSEEMYWMIFLWSWPKVTAVTLINKKLLVWTIKWEPLIKSLQNFGNFIALVMLITWLYFGEILLETFTLAYHLLKIRMCFLRVKHSFGHISVMVGPIDLKRKRSGYTMWPWLLTSLMT